jgi:hypothetical protein
MRGLKNRFNKSITDMSNYYLANNKEDFIKVDTLYRRKMPIYGYKPLDENKIINYFDCLTKDLSGDNCKCCNGDIFMFIYRIFKIKNRYEFKPVFVCTKCLSVYKVENEELILVE